MPYEVKWIKDNLGVSRDSLRYYEKNGLISKLKNPDTNRREYSDEDVQRIWCIKLLQAIGYTVEEVNTIQNSQFDLYDSISEKIVELEKMKQDLEHYIQYAKTIKATGRMPDVSKLGSTQFRDFINYAGGMWNLYSDSKTAKVADMVENLIDGNEQSVAEELQNSIFCNEEIVLGINVGAYYRLLIELSGNDYKSETVQSVVKLLHQYLLENTDLSQYRESFTPKKFAEHFAVTFIPGSDVSKLNIKEFGEESSLFIANAIAFYGGYENVNSIV